MYENVLKPKEQRRINTCGAVRKSNVCSSQQLKTMLRLQHTHPHTAQLTRDNTSQSAAIELVNKQMHTAGPENLAIDEAKELWKEYTTAVTAQEQVISSTLNTCWEKTKRAITKVLSVLGVTNYISVPILKYIYDPDAKQDPFTLLKMLQQILVGLGISTSTNLVTWLLNLGGGLSEAQQVVLTSAQAIVNAGIQLGVSLVGNTSPDAVRMTQKLEEINNNLKRSIQRAEDRNLELTNHMKGWYRATIGQLSPLTTNQDAHYLQANGEAWLQVIRDIKELNKQILKVDFLEGRQAHVELIVQQ